MSTGFEKINKSQFEIENKLKFGKRIKNKKINK